MIGAVLFDLDDTLFLQEQWLRGAWRRVAAEAAALGVPEGDFHSALVDIAAHGSDRGRIIDRALAAVGAADVDAAPLVAAFRQHRAPLTPFPGVHDGLARLRRHVPIGLVSDGDPTLQRVKLESLGLAEAFDVVVWSDEMGRAYRKPDPAPFRRALAALDATPQHTVYIGDRPDKDGRGAAAVGMRFIRVLTGEYRYAPDETEPWRTARIVTDAVALVLRLSRAERGSRAHLSRA